MDDAVLLRMVVAGLSVWAGVWIAEKIWNALSRFLVRRKTIKAIEAGKIPVDYDVVAELVREQNEADDITRATPVKRHNLGNLKRVRERTGLVRLDGFDRAVHDKHRKIQFTKGVKATPYKKGTGEAKQWVRGYCMGANVTDIKRYYDAA